jgi:hypothetical protein
VVWNIKKTASISSWPQEELLGYSCKNLAENGMLFCILLLRSNPRVDPLEALCTIMAQGRISGRISRY